MLQKNTKDNRMTLKQAFLASERKFRAVADAAAHFVEMNAALLVGFVKYSRGSQGQAWTRTDRPARAA